MSDAAVAETPACEAGAGQSEPVSAHARMTRPRICTYPEGSWEILAKKWFPVQGGDKTSHWNASEVLSVAE